MDVNKVWQRMIDEVAVDCTDPECLDTPEDHEMAIWGLLAMAAKRIDCDPATRMRALAILAMLAKEAVGHGVITVDEMEACNPCSVDVSDEMLARIGAWERNVAIIASPAEA